MTITIAPTGFRVLGGPSPGNDTLTHGETFTVTTDDKVSGAATTFGTKTSNDHRWDDCSGTNVGTIWDNYQPQGSSDPYLLAYKTPATLNRGIALPHSNITKYLAAAHYPASDANNGRQIFVGCDHDRANDTYTRWIWKTTCDPNWVFSGAQGGNNHKWYGVTEDYGFIYGGGSSAYWYLEFTDGGFEFTGPEVDEITAGGNDDSIEPDDMLQINHPQGGGQFNPVGRWVNRDLHIKWHASTNQGFIKFSEDAEGEYRELLLNVTGFTDGVTATTERGQGIEGYSANSGTGNYRVMCDIYYDHGPNDGCFFFTDSATWSSSTVIEPQPWVSPGEWTSGASVNLLCNKGRHSAGAKHLHYRSNVNGDMYLGTWTLN